MFWKWHGLQAASDVVKGKRGAIEKALEVENEEGGAPDVVDAVAASLGSRLRCRER